MGEIDDIRAGRWDNRILGRQSPETLDIKDVPAEEPEEVKEVRSYLSIWRRISGLIESLGTRNHYR